MSGWLSIIGSVLLLFMAVFHGSGAQDITETVNGSNAPEFIKSIFPVLFLNTSIHLGTLAAFAFYASLSHARRGIAAIISISVMANASMGALLGEWVPAIVLGLVAAIFATIALRKT